MKPLDSGYTYEVEKLKKDEWHNLLLDFNDASFYQTWSYGSVSWGEDNLSHLVLMKNGKTISLAQLRIAKLLSLPIGFAYLPWGPIWRKKDRDVSYMDLRNMLRALYNEYVIRRGYLLRIAPKQIQDDDGSVRKIFEDEDFSWSSDPMKTVYVDLTPSIEEIKKNIRPTWRHTLRDALKQNLDFTEGSSRELHDNALNLIIEMKKRKRFIEFGSMEDMITVSNDLPETLKIKFLLCAFENKPAAVIGWFPIGTIGHLLLAATGEMALNINASYPIYWKMIEYYKYRGTSSIDLAGISKDRNPGGYTFKTGLAGKSRKERHYIGQFDACENILSSISFKNAMSLRQYYRDLLIGLDKLSK